MSKWLGTKIVEAFARLDGKGDYDTDTLKRDLLRYANQVDRVHVESLVTAGSLRMAAYRVRDPETGDLSPLQFHMTHDNYVLGVMGENAAKLFARFVTDNSPGVEPAPVKFGTAVGAGSEQA